MNKVLYGLLAITLAACVPAQDPVASTPQDLMSSGSAVIVTRGFARQSGTVVGGKFLSYNVSAGYTANLLSNAGGWAHDTGEYRIQKVRAGSYIISAIGVGTASTFGKPSPTSQRAFSVAAGEVVYLGDIDLRAVSVGRGLMPIATITDQSSTARAALASEAPDLAPLMKTRLLGCEVCVTR